MMKLIKSLLLSLSLLMISGHHVYAEIMTLPGTTVDFIYDDTNIDALFGTLQVSGDAIFVTPVDFNASSTDGVAAHTAGTAIDFVNAIGTIQIVAKTGYAFEGINVGESGIYNMTGTSDVSMNASLRLFDFNDPVPVFGTEENTNLSSASDYTLNDGLNHNWVANGGFDMTTLTWDGINHVGLTLTNTLTATSGAGEVAFIQKNGVGGDIVIDIKTIPAIPVPAAFWLFGSGLLGLVGLARRKSLTTYGFSRDSQKGTSRLVVTKRFTH